MSETSNIHEGHRKRLKERFQLEGLEHFSEVNALELLLFYCVPRKDTNPLAHRLLNHFGSLSGVMGADFAELMQVEGVTEHIAIYLTMISQFSRYTAIKEVPKKVRLTTTQQCGRYMIPFFQGRTKETVAVACLDASCRVICCKIVGEGSVTSANFSIRKVVELALSSKAASVVLAHNHPGGVAIPSAEDIATTVELAQALSGLDIILADHIVVCGNDFTSFVDSRTYNPAVYMRRGR